MKFGANPNRAMTMVMSKGLRSVDSDDEAGEDGAQAKGDINATRFLSKLESMNEKLKIFKQVFYNKEPAYVKMSPEML